jgi:hypothetical protein
MCILIRDSGNSHTQLETRWGEGGDREQVGGAGMQ